MAKLYGEIAKSALLTLDKSFSRALGQPLDASEVYYSLAAAKAYAATPAAYIGQKIVVIEDGKVYHYSVEDAAGTLKELGVRPTGDGKSITVDANGVIGIFGAAAADSLTLPRMKEDKSGIEWVPVSAVVQGDGNDNTTYDFALNETGTGIVITTKFNGVEVEEGQVTIDLDVYTKKEVDDAIKVVADKIGVAAEGQIGTLYELIAAEVLRATTAEEALGDRIGVAKSGENAATGVYAYVDGVVEALVNGVDAEKIDSLNELIAWVEAHPAIVEELDGRLDVVEAKLVGIGGEEEPATVVEAIADAIEAENLGQYAKTADLVDAYSKDEVNALIGTPGTPEKGEEGTEGYKPAVAGTGVYQHVYSKTEVTDLIADITGGESAADVKAELTAYKTTNDARVKAIEDKYADVEVDAEKNIIEIVKVNNVALEPDAERAVNLVINSDTLADGAALKQSINDAAALAQTGVDNAATAKGAADAAQDAADAAQETANEALGKANANAQAITQLTNGQVATNKTNIENLAALVGTIGDGKTDTLAGKIGALEAHDQAHATEFNTLSGKVDQNTADIAKKANADKTYTKGEVDALLVPLALAANVYDKTAADNKFLAKADYTPYNDTEVRGLITAEEKRAKDEEARIEGLVSAEEKRADTEEKRIVGLVEAEAATARAAEKKNAEDILALDATLKAALENDGEGLDSIKELAAWISEHETEVLPVVNKNKEDIAALTLRVTANETAVGTTLPAAITKALEDAKKYTDDTMVKADGVTIENKEGVFGVKAISTDLLVQGELELILNGGNASLN